MITQKHHHPLTLIDSVKEDNPLIQYLMDSNDKVDYSMDYYCDICETPGNPKRHAYCRKECNYIAHMECIISKDNTPQENPSNLNLKNGTAPKKEQKMSDESDRSTEQAAQSMSKKNGATSDNESNEELFSHPSHPHMLTLLQHEESEEDESDDESSEEEISDDDGSSKEKIKYCIGCNEVMCFPGYACHECKLYLHKSCAELPTKILHPLHPHPLTCSLTDYRDIDEFLICDGCRDLIFGFNFSCSWCGFNLDTKCASKQDQEHHQQTFKEPTLYRLYHEHALKLCIVQKLHGSIVQQWLYDTIFPCCCCRQSISGSAYCCLKCHFFIHESCKEIPKQVQHPFHPQHLLLPQAMDKYDYDSKCDACKRSILGIKIGCNECNFQLHVSCANPNICACALKHACHEHNMYYFVEDDTTGYYECNNCHQKCVNESFYRCVECDFNLHLKCIPIPSCVMIILKHHHPLTLIDSVKEDNPFIQYLKDLNDKVDYSMDYYCDICETPGNPKRHAYCCKECIFIAHVECIISKNGATSKFQV
ncbi:hypothetical protein Q3G72_032000 [Acer saccharum]|nr:hypothetical protein Q3G72_032000 [Acer saccharum]